MTRKTISVPEAVYEEAHAHKGDRTWADVLLDGAHAGKTDTRRDEPQGEPHPAPLTADDLPMIRNAIADELENRLTQR